MNIENLIIEHRPYGSTSIWRETTLDDFLIAVRITKEIIEETGQNKEVLHLYEKEAALRHIKSGRILTTPVSEFRLANGKECPICQSKFIGMGALSRRDNKTEICSQCGVNEALEDITKAITLA